MTMNNKKIHKKLSKRKEDYEKELFDVVYQWGRVGIVTDHKCNTFQNLISKINSTNNKKTIETKFTKIGKLYWSDNLGEMNWHDAQKKCEKLGGRLPTRIELIDLVDNHRDEIKHLYSPGPNFWASTENYSNSGGAWFVALAYGTTHYTTKSSSGDYYAVCVKYNK